MTGDLSLHFVSCICGEIIATKSIEFTEEETLPVFKSFRDMLQDATPACGNIIGDNNTGTESGLFWQYSPDGFLKIKDFLTVSTFLNLVPADRQTLYLLVGDAENFPRETKKYLEMLDLMELRDEKAKMRSKYDLKSEADDIQEQILQLQQELFDTDSAQGNTGKKLLENNNYDFKNAVVTESIQVEGKKSETNNFLKKDTSDTSEHATVFTELPKEHLFTPSTEQSVTTDVKTYSLKETAANENIRANFDRNNSFIGQDVGQYDSEDIKPSTIDQHSLERVNKENQSPSIKSIVSEQSTSSVLNPIVVLKPIATDFDDYSSHSDTKSENDTKSQSTIRSYEIDRETKNFVEELLCEILEKVVNSNLVKPHFSLEKPNAFLFENEQLKQISRDKEVAGDETNILLFALRKMPVGKCYTTDLCSGYSIIDCLKKAAMKGRIINCSPHTDIYFLEADTQTQPKNPKNEETNLESLFVSPAGREMLKYKPTGKMTQQKMVNSNLEFFTNRAPTIRQSPTSARSQHLRKSCNNKFSPSTSIRPPSSESCSSCGTPSSQESSLNSRRSSIDLYEEAASILGLTCAQTDDCRCLECQCHYFDDFDESEIVLQPGHEFGNATLLNIDSTASQDSTSDSTCSIQ